VLRSNVRARPAETRERARTALLDPAPGWGLPQRFTAGAAAAAGLADGSADAALVGGSAAPLSAAFTASAAAATGSVGGALVAVGAMTATNACTVRLIAVRACVRQKAHYSPAAGRRTLHHALQLRPVAEQHHLALLALRIDHEHNVLRE